MDGVAFDSLMAQKEAAYWAGAAAVAAWGALIALPINGIGIYLVWRQLRINESALQDAKRSADASVIAAETAAQTTRPWMALEIKKENCRIRRKGGALSLMLDVTIKNIGRTPAVGIWVVQKAEPYKFGCDLISELHRGYVEWHQNAGRTIFPDEVEQTNRNVVLPDIPEGADIQQWNVAIVIFYYIPGSAIRRETSKVIRVSQEEKRGDNEAWNVEIRSNLIARRDPT